jgi:PAS domain S-box-containing protein
MPQIVWTGRPDGPITYFNDRWYQYTGLTPGASLGRDGLLTVTHPDDRDRFARLRAQSLDAGEGFESEVRLRHRSAGYRWHLLRAVPVLSEAGRVVRRFGTATDIDSLKQAEESESVPKGVSCV